MRPTLPVACPVALVTAEAAELTVSPADEVTFDKPSEAFDVTEETASFAFVTVDGEAVVVPAVVVVVEALRTPARRRANCDCRSTDRRTVEGMMGGMWSGVKG